MAETKLNRQPNGKDQTQPPKLTAETKLNTQPHGKGQTHHHTPQQVPAPPKPPRIAQEPEEIGVKQLQISPNQPEVPPLIWVTPVASQPLVPNITMTPLTRQSQIAELCPQNPPSTQQTDMRKGQGDTPVTSSSTVASW